LQRTAKRFIARGAIQRFSGYRKPSLYIFRPLMRLFDAPLLLESLTEEERPYSDDHKPDEQYSRKDK
jgi:hypothetical protein